MTEQMKAFLIELAGLLEKHDADIDVYDDRLGVIMGSRHDKETDRSIREFCEVELLSLDPQIIRSVIEEQSNSQPNQRHLTISDRLKRLGEIDRDIVQKIDQYLDNEPEFFKRPSDPNLND